MQAFGEMTKVFRQPPSVQTTQISKIKTPQNQDMECGQEKK